MRLKIKWSKKKKRTLPADNVCRNCGASTVGRYCHECGQDVISGTGQPIFELVSNLLDNAFAFDGKVPLTVANLVARPGFLSKEYRVGRISRYMHPVKLFWLSTLIFFALLISRINIDAQKEAELKQDSTTEQIAAISDSSAMRINPIEEEDSKNKTDEDKKTEITINGREVDVSTEEMLGYVSTYGPFVAFLLIPVFALLLALFFWKKRSYYIYDLVFAVHFHAFLWIFFSLLIVTSLVFPNISFPNWLNVLLILMPGVYLSIAIHRYYQTLTRWNAIWKAIVIGLLYFFLVVVVTIILLVLLVSLVYGL